jgi:hypothetical protein
MAQQLRAAPRVHAKGFVHADSACLKFFRTHWSTPNSLKLSGLAKSEDFHAIAKGPLIFLPCFISGFIFGRFCVTTGLSMAPGSAWVGSEVHWWGAESATDQGISWRDSREFHYGTSLWCVMVEKKNLTKPAACAGPAQHHLARPVHRGPVEKLLEHLHPIQQIAPPQHFLDEK